MNDKIERRREELAREARDDFEGVVIGQLATIETKLDFYSEEQKYQRAKIEGQGKDIAGLQVKAGVWGLLGGLLAGIGAALGLKG